jgi:hypothetical protein
MRLATILALLALLAGSASARPRRSKLNMPPGWTWPPSAAMKADGARCLAHLDALGIKWRRAPAVRKVTTPIYIEPMALGGVEITTLWKKGPFVMDCALVAALADTADVLRSAGVAALLFSEIHDYRNINDGKRPILSRHALGIAIDVFAIVTDDGVRHTVETDYPDAFLLTVEEWLRATSTYRILTPGNDPRHHHDHFHLEVREGTERPAVASVDADAPVLQEQTARLGDQTSVPVAIDAPGAAHEIVLAPAELLGGRPHEPAPGVRLDLERAQAGLRGRLGAGGGEREGHAPAVEQLEERDQAERLRGGVHGRDRRE